MNPQSGIAVGLTGLFVALLVVASDANARTLRVAQDGSGDHTTLQSALNAAESGDTISVAPGSYELTAPIPPSSTFLCHGFVWGKSLSIVGDHPESVIIGPELPTPGFPDDRPYGIVAWTDTPLSVSRITFRNLSSAIHSYGSQLVVLDCRFVSNNAGIDAHNVPMVRVASCVFNGSRWAGIFSQGPLGAGDTLVEHCTFEGERTAFHSNSLLARFLHNTVSGGDVGVLITDGVSRNALISDCRFEAQSNVSVVVNRTAQLELNNCYLGISSVCLGVDGTIRGSGNTVAGGTEATIWTTYEAIWDFHGNNILNGGAWTVGGSFGPSYIELTSHDLTGNYWGSEDPSQIRTWILDQNADARVRFSVEFEPFQLQPIPTQSVSMSTLRGLFGDH